MPTIRNSIKPVGHESKASIRYKTETGNGPETTKQDTETNHNTHDMKWLAINQNWKKKTIEHDTWPGFGPNTDHPSSMTQYKSQGMRLKCLAMNYRETKLKMVDNV